MTEQLPLDLALPPRFGRDDLLVSPANAEAVAAVDRWPDWPDPVLILVGPEGAGKSHVASIWAAEARARPCSAADLRRLDATEWSGRPVLLEDADRLAGVEMPLFHLINLVRAERSSLLITARRGPGAWGLATPDLLSRLRLAPAVALGAPDDALMRAVLVKLLADRQLVVDEAVVNYLATRLGRSLGDARAAVDGLDRAGLALHRRVTRPVAAKVLDVLRLDRE